MSSHPLNDATEPSLLFAPKPDRELCSVPEGYFDALPERVDARISKKRNSFIQQLSGLLKQKKIYIPAAVGLSMILLLLFVPLRKASVPATESVENQLLLSFDDSYAQEVAALESDELETEFNKINYNLAETPVRETDLTDSEIIEYLGDQEPDPALLNEK